MPLRNVAIMVWLAFLIGQAAEIAPASVKRLSPPDPKMSAAAGPTRPSFLSSLNRDGSRALFVSAATNVTPHDFSSTNGPWLNIVVRDETAGRTTLVSVTHDGNRGGQS